MALKAGAAALVFFAVLLSPAPDGLTPDGQRALAVMAFAVVLWATEVVPIALTGMACVVLLVLVNAVPGVGEALYGFSQPVSYFLIGILSLGLAVHKSGLAERIAVYLVRLASGNPKSLYFQMLVSFAVMAFALPSASTRGAIMVYIYEQALAHWHVPAGSTLSKGIMMAMGSLNRLASTALLAGGITPVVASSLLGDFSWGRWFVLMALPFYAILAFGGLALFLLYRSGFKTTPSSNLELPRLGPVTWAEKKAAVIATCTALLWFTDFAHGLHPSIPALIAMCAILMPGIGLLSWRDLEQELGWSVFIVVATSLSLSQALVTTGAASWFAETLVNGAGMLHDSPLILLLALCAAAAMVRAMMTNIAGYLAFLVPVAMAAAGPLGLNPLLCGFAVVVVGDSIVYYPTSATASVIIFQRANLPAPEVLRFGLVMTVVTVSVLFAIILPYWNLIGIPLTL